MTRVSASLLSVLAAALWPAQGQAQVGPSFNCADSDTPTELAICGNPELSQLELQMYASYLRLVDAVGERRARNIADRFLERRQACGSDEACIAERLRISLRVFERRAGGTTQLAGREPSEGELTGRDLPGGDVAGLEAPAAPAIEAPVEEVAAIPSPPARPERFAFLEAQPQPPVIEDDLALAEPTTLAEEELALAPEPLSPIEEPAFTEEPAPIDAPAPIEDDVAASEPPEAALPEEEIASAEPIDPDLPLAAQAPLPSNLDALLEEEPTETANAEPVPEEEVAEPTFEEASAEPLPTIDEAVAEPLPATEEASAEPLPTVDEPLSAPEEAVAEALPTTDEAVAEALPAPDETAAEPPPAIEEASVDPLPASEEASVTEEASIEPTPSSEEIGGAIDGAELASSDEPAPFDSAVSWAFMDLNRDQRAEVQTRLQAVGLYEGSAEGAWNLATLAAMEGFLASEEGASFDPSNQTGAALALDFIRSDAYAEAHGLPALESASDPDDPLASTDW